jgi:hypothetical protein
VNSSRCAAQAEFDFLKSVEIEEKVNQICWCRGSNGALFLLSTNGTWGWHSVLDKRRV